MRVTLIVQQICKLLTVMALGVLIAQKTGLRPYMQVIGGGLFVGVVACWTYARMPGGKPMRRSDNEAAEGITASSVPSVKSMWATVRVDRSFAIYLIGMVVTIIGQCMLGSFVPLFLKSVAGMPSSRVIWLDAAGMMGGLGDELSGGAGLPRSFWIQADHASVNGDGVSRFIPGGGLCWPSGSCFLA